MSAGRTNSEALSQHWCTPPKYVDAVKEFFGGSIALDPCSNRHSIVNAQVEYSLPETDGLAASWDYPTVFVNPPYGRDRERCTTIRDWLRKCAEASGAWCRGPRPGTGRYQHPPLEAVGIRRRYVSRVPLRYAPPVPGRRQGWRQRRSDVVRDGLWGPRHAQFEQTFIRHGAVVRLEHLHGRSVGCDAYPKPAENGERQRHLFVAGGRADHLPGRRPPE